MKPMLPTRWRCKLKRKGQIIVVDMYRGRSHTLSTRLHMTRYPSSELESLYMTNKSMVYALVMVGVFMFSVILFLAYDCTVERRQQIVMNTAEKSTAVLSSLFPGTVRDRILHEADLKQRQPPSNGTKSLQTFLSREHDPLGLTEDFKSSKPIADFFPETTIIFADLVGFTAWR
jgi:hypothetical protein